MSQSAILEKVKNEVRYQWPIILGALAPDLSPALNRIGKHVACPMHGGKDGFRFFKDSPFRGAAICNTCGHFNDGFALLMYINGWNFWQCVNAIAEYLVLPVSASNHHSNDITKRSTNTNQTYLEEKRRADKDSKLSTMLDKYWADSLSISSPKSGLARQYFHNRGIDITQLPPLDHTVRFHPALPYFEGNKTKVCNLPVILGKVTSFQGDITLMRTYINVDGFKAKVSSPKKLMPILSHKSLTGSAIRLTGEIVHEQIMGVAEGIETGLSVAQATKMPVWSCVNAHQVSNFEPPKSIQKIVIWADLDRSKTGVSVAEKLQIRMAQRGIETCIRLPPFILLKEQKGWDWNDALVILGTRAFK